MATREEIEAELKRLSKLTDKAFRVPGAGQTSPVVIPGIGLPGRCTDTAVHLARKFGGVVMGYRKDKNPGAVMGVYGHDFAVIDGRWLADFWAKDTMEYRWLYDLLDPVDQKEAWSVYGEPGNWEEMPASDFERYDPGV